MAVLGMRGTGDWATGERPKNFREMILWRQPNGKAPLTALMSKMRSQNVDDPEFNWFEEELKPVRILVTGTITTTTYVTVVIDEGDAQDLVVGDLLLVEKAAAVTATFNYEVLQVSTVTSATQFEVARGAAGTTAAAIPDNAYLLKIGSAFEEGSAAPTASTRNPTKYLNYTQIFKTVYDITNTAKVTNTRTGDPVKNDKKRKMFDHSVSLENAFLFGAPYEDISGTKPKRYTGGLMYWLTQAYNATNAPTIQTISSTTTTGEDDFLDATYQCFDYSSELSGTDRLVLCGNGFLNYMNKWAKDMGSTRVNYNGVINLWGMKLQEWVIPQGTFYLKTHPLMNVNSRYTNGAFVIDPGGIVYRPLRGRDTKFKDNIQNNDVDGQKGQWLTECGMEAHHLKGMRYIAVE